MYKSWAPTTAFVKSDTSAVYPGEFVPTSQQPYTRWRCNFKGLSKDGDVRIFLKISTPLSLIKAFRMNLISVGSILLDSTM